MGFVQCEDYMNWIYKCLAHSECPANVNFSALPSTQLWSGWRHELWVLIAFSCCREVQWLWIGVAWVRATVGGNCPPQLRNWFWANKNGITIMVLKGCSGCLWLRPVILATQEAEIRRMAVWNQPGQIVYKTLSQKSRHKKRVGGWWSSSRCRHCVQIPVPPKKKQKGCPWTGDMAQVQALSSNFNTEKQKQKGCPYSWKCTTDDFHWCWSICTEVVKSLREKFVCVSVCVCECVCVCVCVCVKAWATKSLRDARLAVVDSGWGQMGTLYNVLTLATFV
jgi:hypothetical protein